MGKVSRGPVSQTMRLYHVPNLALTQGGHYGGNLTSRENMSPMFTLEEIRKQETFGIRRQAGLFDPKIEGQYASTKHQSCNRSLSTGLFLRLYRRKHIL
jgi:hypothetical protein